MALADLSCTRDEWERWSEDSEKAKKEPHLVEDVDTFFFQFFFFFVVDGNAFMSPHAGAAGSLCQDRVKTGSTKERRWATNVFGSTKNTRFV